TVSRLSAASAFATGRTGVVVISGAEDGADGPDAPHAEAMSPRAALLAPLSTVRRSTFDERSQSVPPTKTPLASPREAQSSGPQCEGGVADARGFVIIGSSDRRAARLCPARPECAPFMPIGQLRYSNRRPGAVPAVSPPAALLP